LDATNLSATLRKSLVLSLFRRVYAVDDQDIRRAMFRIQRNLLP
jgi:hypothetical protein